MSVTFVINEGQLNRLLSGSGGDVNRAIIDLGQKVESRAKIKAPVDTGQLRASIQHTPDGDGVLIGSNVQHALYQEQGTAPHVIRPVNAKALYWPGAAHPVAKVNHPGNPGVHFLERALEEVIREI